MGIAAFSITQAPAVPSTPGWTAGLYYGSATGVSVSAYTTGAAATGATFAAPVEVPDDVTIDRLGAEITTISAGKTFRVAIYRADGVRRRPGSLIVDSGALSAGSLGFIEATISVALLRGLVWFAIQAEDSTMQFRTAGFRNQRVGKTAGGGTSLFGQIAVTQAFGAFPATFPAGAAPNSSLHIIDARAA